MIENASKYVGKRIEHASMTETHVLIRFDDGVRIFILDNGQQCCEERWMSSDDDLGSLVGGLLVAIELKDGTPEEYDRTGVDAEIQFLEIRTDRGFVTIVNYNDHNGYYGGFEIEIQEGP